MILKVRVIPNSKNEEVIEDKENKIIIVKTKEKPEKGRATSSVIKILENHFKKRVKLVRGKFSREKIISIEE